MKVQSEAGDGWEAEQRRVAPGCHGFGVCLSLRRKEKGTE